MHVHGHRNVAYASHRRSYAASGNSRAAGASRRHEQRHRQVEDGTNKIATADTVEGSTATSTGTNAANTESADATTAATGSTTGRSPSRCKTKASTGTETWTSTKHRQRTSYSNKLPSVVFCNSSTKPIWFNTCLIAYVSTYLIRSSVSSLVNRLNSFSVR